jgi:hypothetical protein
MYEACTLLCLFSSILSSRVSLYHHCTCTCLLAVRSYSLTTIYLFVYVVCDCYCYNFAVQYKLSFLM